MLDKFISDFQRDGYVNIGQILKPGEIIELKKISNDLLEKNPKTDFSFNQNVNNDYLRPTLDHCDWSVLDNIIGISSDLDQIMEKFFSNKIFKEVLECNIGKNYKLWTCCIRLAKGNDNGLGFHSDSKGEIGVTILLEDQIDEKGTTSVIRGSHKWPISSQETKSESIPTKILKPFSTAITGKAGDTILFFKKTLHGRIAHGQKKPGIAIMAAIFPTGYMFTPYNVPQEILDKVGPETNRLMSKDTLEDINNTGTFTVTGERKKLYIDEIESLKLSFLSPWNILKLYPMLVVKPVQITKSVIKKFF
jgi:putative 2OG-Fe(II) oxygenase